MKNDLVKFAERKMPFFFMILSLWVHKNALEDSIGTGFTKSVFIYDEDLCKLCVSKEEMEKVAEKVSELVKNKDKRFKVWYERAKQLNIEADKLLKEYSSGKCEISPQKYDEALKILVDNAGYTTIMSYWILYGINKEIEKGARKESFGEILDMWEEIKSETRYPQIAKVVFGVYFAQASKLSNIPEALATRIHPAELRSILFEGETFSSEIFEKRARCAITRGDRPYDVNYIFDDSLISEFRDEIGSRTEIKGVVAFKGVVRGIAKIVNSIDDMAKFNEGDILVSIQSSPALMPAIIKSSAIVADEGGIMCHASVISRELKKPCIIGTQIATKALEDGDMVEVDAERGIVRKI